MENGGFAYTDFASRIMSALGSTANRAVLSLASGQLNGIKQCVSLLQVAPNWIRNKSLSELCLILYLGFHGQMWAQMKSLRDNSMTKY